MSLSHSAFTQPISIIVTFWATPSSVWTSYVNAPLARSNVFDGDEFDVNSRDRLDMGRVHKGKHSLSKAGKNANALLEDKRDLQGLKDRFAKLVRSFRVLQH